jgi:head-tail adaptor
MRRVRSGLMRTPFLVLNRTTDLDEFGSLEPTFLGVGTIVWGYLKGTSAAEGVEREQVTHQRSYEIMMREKDAALLSVTARLQTDTRTFEIIGIEQYDARQQTVTVTVREVA